MPMIVNEHLRIPIDFRPARGYQNSDLIYTALIHQKGTGTTATSSSGMIVKAYKSYDPSELEFTTYFADLVTRAKTFIKRFDIKSESDLMFKINNSQPELFELKEPAEKNFSFPLKDPDVEEMWNKLDAVRYRDRGIMVYKFLYQYLAHGNDQFYCDLCADLMLQWLKDEAEAMKGIDSKRLLKVSKQIFYMAEFEKIPIDTSNALANMMGVAK